MMTRSQPGSTESAILQFGQLGLRVCLGVIVSGLVLLIWSAPQLVPFVPVVILAGVGFWYLLRHPLLHLSVVLATFALVADFDEGIDISEVLFGILYASYLGIWFFRQLFLRKEPLIQSSIDRLALLILILVTVYVFVGWLFGAKLPNALREWQSWTMFAFYFPVKDACRRYPKGVQAILAMVILMALFVSVRNVIQLKSLVASAAQVWQITKKGRIISNEVILVSGGLIGVVAASYYRRFSSVVIASLMLMTFLIGLVLTQSRGYWLGFAFGTFAIFLLETRAGKKRLAGIALASLGVGLVLLVVLFGDIATLLYAGLVDRVLSIGSGTTDMSLLNRLLEVKAAWKAIRVNPILGYGLGREFSYFDLTIAGTRRWAFIHNGYVALLFKFGVLGTLCILAFWAKTLLGGIRQIKQYGFGDWRGRGCLIAVGVLVSFIVSAMTANPFFLSDTLLLFAVFGGIAAAAIDSQHD